MKTQKIEISIDLLVPNRWNPNQQNKELFQKGVKSVEKYGMLSFPLVRETAGCYEIIDGEHRWRYCKELGYQKIEVENLGEISDEEAKTLTILLNNLRGKDDIEKRAKILKELSEGQLQLLPFSKEQIEVEKELLDFDFEKYNVPGEMNERKIDSTLCISLTEEERNLWDETLRVAKKENRNDVQLLMKMIEDYLELRVMRNEEGKWIFN